VINNVKHKRNTQRRNLSITFVISLVVIMAAFFSGSYFNPQNDEWISVDQSKLSIGAILLEIDDSAIWEINNDGNELRQHIYDTLQIKVNGEPIAKEHIIFMEGFSVPTQEFSNGEEAGFHYGTMYGYVLDLDLQLGTYVLEISTTSISGISYSYTQEFIVLNSIPTTSP
jgi:hypothetical protein